MAPHLTRTFEPLRTLADRAKVSRDTARTALLKLEELGQCDVRTTKSGDQYRRNDTTPRGLF